MELLDLHDHRSSNPSCDSFRDQCQPPFLPDFRFPEDTSLILLPSDTVEDEARRNTFWLLYAMERMGACSNGWALCLDDQDVS
jgi:hypothetical protein